MRARQVSGEVSTAVSRLSRTYKNAPTVVSLSVAVLEGDLPTIQQARVVKSASLRPAEIAACPFWDLRLFTSEQMCGPADMAGRGLRGAQAAFWRCDRSSHHWCGCPPVGAVNRSADYAAGECLA